MVPFRRSRTECEDKHGGVATGVFHGTPSRERSRTLCNLQVGDGGLDNWKLAADRKSTQAVSCIGLHWLRNPNTARDGKFVDPGAAIALPGGLEIRRYEHLTGAPDVDLNFDLNPGQTKLAFHLASPISEYAGLPNFWRRARPSSADPKTRRARP